jgi:hypothetical protein
MALQGNLEGIQEDGLVSGWCWDPTDPDRRVRLTVLVDNEPVGSAVADTFRPDLETAGIGDGAYAFSFLLPWKAVSTKSVSTVHVVDTMSHHSVGGALTFRRSALLPVEQRLSEMEQSVRLLQARLEEATERARHDTTIIRSVLGTIGAFFSRIAEMPLENVRSELVTSLGGLLANVRSEFMPFSLAVPSDPRICICIDGGSSVRELYGCLSSIKAASLDENAEIFVIDDGRSDEASLLPALVQNIRYWRLQPGQSILDARNRAARLFPYHLVLFVSPAVRVTAGWLSAAQATFAERASCAVIGSRIMRPDGTIGSSGLLPDRRGRLSDFAYSQAAETPWCNRLTPVAAVADVALLVRGSVFSELDGFDFSFTEVPAAVVDLCLRCWDNGHSVLYQPACRLNFDGHEGLASGSGHAAMDAGVATLLMQRWRSSPRVAWPLHCGQVLLLDDSTGIIEAGPGVTETTPVAQESALALQTLGYDVMFGNLSGLDSDPAESEGLRHSGVQVARAPFHPSVATLIKDALPAYDVIQITARGTVTMAPETIRNLSPTSRIILALDEGVEAIIADPVANAVAAHRLLAAVDSSDCVLARTEASVAYLRDAGKGGKLRRFVPPRCRGHAERRGLWLLLAGSNPEATADAHVWLTKILPAIAKALPDHLIHATEGNIIRTPLPGVHFHPPSAVDSKLLSAMRLAFAPFRVPAVAPEAISACTSAGLPVVATPAALDGIPPPGVLQISTSSRDLRKLTILMEDAVAWEKLAAPLLVAATSTGSNNASLDTLATYRALLESFGLPLR